MHWLVLCWTCEIVRRCLYHMLEVGAVAGHSLTDCIVTVMVRFTAYRF